MPPDSPSCGALTCTDYHTLIYGSTNLTTSNLMGTALSKILWQIVAETNWYQNDSPGELSAHFGSRASHRQQVWWLCSKAKDVV